MIVGCQKLEFAWMAQETAPGHGAWYGAPFGPETCMGSSKACYLGWGTCLSLLREAGHGAWEKETCCRSSDGVHAKMKAAWSGGWPCKLLWVTAREIKNMQVARKGTHGSWFHARRKTGLKWTWAWSAWPALVGYLGQKWVSLYGP